jgi:group II intron reverse transcriptase/maturase
MAHVDRQGVRSAEPVCRQRQRDRQPGSSGSGSSIGGGLPGPSSGRTGPTARSTADGDLPTAGGATRLDPEAGKQRATTTVRDRVVQTALLQLVEPIFDVTFSDSSYGFRHGRGCRQALQRVEELLNAGHVYVVDADLKSYFDTISKPRLMAHLRQKVSDQRVLRLMEMFLEQGVLDGLREWTPETGTPQGAVLSPLLANIYLNPLDHLLAEAGLALVRYADDCALGNVPTR